MKWVIFWIAGAMLFNVIMWRMDKQIEKHTAACVAKGGVYIQRANICVKELK
jgi:hypothetical protein